MRAFAFALACALAIVTMTGCAADAERKTASQESDPSKGVICTYEVPTGSSIRERKCTTPEEREDARRQSEHQVYIEPGRGNAR